MTTIPYDSPYHKNLELMAIHALNHACSILLNRKNMVLLKFVEEFLSQITSQSRPDGIKGNVGISVKITSVRYGL